MGVIQVQSVVRVAVGVAAVLVQAALAFYYVGLAVFVAPQPAIFVLACLWIVEMVAVIWLATRNTWRAPLVPIVSFVAVLLTYEYGKASLGWGA